MLTALIQSVRSDVDKERHSLRIEEFVHVAETEAGKKRADWNSP